MPNETASSDLKIADAKSTARYSHDGALIEGTLYDGRVHVVQKTPEFFRDIVPYFAPTCVLMFTHIVYAYSGNSLLFIWLMYLTVPIITFLT